MTHPMGFYAEATPAVDPAEACRKSLQFRMMQDGKDVSV